jgi:CBS domain-containing protein
MAKQVRDLMNQKPIKVPRSSSLIDAARKMREAGVGAIVVEDDGKICGLITDRDIAIRAVAQGRDPNTTRVIDICSTELTTLSPNDDLDRAIDMMRKKAIRRVPVVDASNQAVGILSLGDLAMERDPRSVLGQISAAPPNQ